MGSSKCQGGIKDSRGVQVVGSVRRTPCTSGILSQIRRGEHRVLGIRCGRTSGVSVLSCGMCVSRPLGTESARHGVQHVTRTISHTRKRVRTTRTTGLHHRRARSTQRPQARAHSVTRHVTLKHEHGTWRGDCDESDTNAHV